MSLRNALLFSAIGLAWTLPALGQGCQHDMQCKGDRICNMGTCTAPDADGSDASTPTSSANKSMPTIKLSPQQSSPPSSQPQQPSQPSPQQSPPSQSQPQSQHVSVPRSCCTVAGKLRLAPAQSGDAPLVAGDACQGMTTTGKPVPGTACN
ncbi:hypothetical protein [Cupriavidus pauculus]|uniref:Uncharacterized protein n=1 Tax=Cupriavidus pauculus TaxID=82633 RepID=A0A2N5C3P9_9BURK|nr:hypothetical protein [Cupriavidus pauculus]PLP96853.1 hypothetical protein CYJ10_30145 [Cupriavidus pauculus]